MANVVKFRSHPEEWLRRCVKAAVSNGEGLAYKIKLLFESLWPQSFFALIPWATDHPLCPVL